MKNEIANQFADIQESFSKEIKEVFSLYKKLSGVMNKATMIAFETGRLLLSIKDSDPAMPWQAFVKETFPFSIKTANTYIRLYEEFSDRPEQLEGLSCSEAYIESGLTVLAKQNQGLLSEPRPGRLQNASNEKQLELDIEELFSHPTAAKINLERYRIVPVEKTGTLWMFDKKGNSIPVAELYAAPPQGLPKKEHAALMTDVQKAIETYFARIEEYENKGIIRGIA